MDSRLAQRAFEMGHCTLAAQRLIQDRRALEAQLDEWIRDWRNEGLRSKHYALAAQDRRALEAQRDQWIRYWRNERLRSEHCALTIYRGRRFAFFADFLFSFFLFILLASFFA